MKFQKLIALLLALVMVLALAACGNDDSKKDDGDKDPVTSTTAPTDPADPTDPPADPTDPPADPTDPPSGLEGLAKDMVGIWTTTLSFDGEAMGVPAFTGTLDMTIAIAFMEDGTYSMAMDTDSFEACIDDNKDALVAGMIQLLYDTYGGEASAEAQVQDSLKMSCAEYAAAYVDTLKDTLSMDEEEGTWSVDGSVMLLDDEEVDVAIEGDEMTWTGEPVEMFFATEEQVFVRVVE